MVRSRTFNLDSGAVVLVSINPMPFEALYPFVFGGKQDYGMLEVYCYSWLRKYVSFRH